MFEIDLKVSLDKCTDKYCEEYEKRYKTKPLSINSQINQTTLKDMVKQFGKEKVIALLETFFKMNGYNNFYVQKAHSIEVFRRDIDMVNAELGKKTSYKAPVGGIRIQTLLACDRCGKHFMWVGDPSKLNEERWCGCK